MTTERKVYISTGVATFLLIVGAIFLFSNQSTQVSKPLLGEEIQVSGSHVPAGTQITYSTNPPTGGEHYGDSTTHAGVYDKPQQDGYLVHSLEHGAVILWYRSNIPPNDLYRLTKIFEGIMVIKKIMTPRSKMDTPITLTSWGRILKLKDVDEKQIKAFFETNEGQGPEQAPI